MTSSLEVRWTLRQVEDVARFRHLPSTSVFQHPLASAIRWYVDTRSAQEQESEEALFVDPLGATIEEAIGPNVTKLTSGFVEEAPAMKKEITLTNTLETKRRDAPVVDIEYPDFEPWRTKRRQILDSFNTCEKMSISSSFLPHMATTVNITDKTKHRLEVLEDLSGLKKIGELSQKEFIDHVNELRELFILAWNNNKRVEAVRLITELARMLSSISTASFYPSQWILVTEIIELFGDYVYQRLLDKANEERIRVGQPPLSQYFQSDHVLPIATETAKNWFCKIADIKEIIPRFYVETCLIRCLRFLDSSAMKVNIMRLVTMTQKFPHHLPAAYGRAFICKTAMRLYPNDRGPHWKAINDWMQNPDVNQPELVWPALEWIIQCVSYGAHSSDDLAPLWEYCKLPTKQGFLLKAVINALPPSYLAEHSLIICPLVVSDESSSVEICAFGERLMLHETPESSRAQILRSIWKKISRIESLSACISCSVVWSRFASRYFTLKEVNVITEHVVKRLSSAKNHDKYLSDVVRIVQNIVEYRGTDIIQLVQTNSFFTLIAWLRDEPFASLCAKDLLAAFIRIFNVGELDDLTVAYLLVEQCGRLCLSLRADSLYDDIRNASRLISAALDRPNLSKDAEKGLALIVYARSTLCEMELVIRHIVYLMISFSLQCTSSLKDSSKKANFMRACIANLFITIPSIEDGPLRIRSTIQSAHISLLANSLPQTDALIRLCLETMDSSLISPSQLSSLSSQFLSLLVYVPDSPEKPILYMFNAFFNVIERKQWTNELPAQVDVLLSCLQYLWTMSQPHLFSSFRNVQSNHFLYGSSTEFREAIQVKLDIVMQKLLKCIEDDISPKQVVVLPILENIVEHIEIGDDEIVILVGNLLKRVARHWNSSNRLSSLISSLIVLSLSNPSLKSLLHRLNIL